MEHILDFAASGYQVVGRQRTLRDTIGWSYALLSSDEERLFRQLGVFVGGAGLDVVRMLTAPDRRSNDSDPLDLVASLVDASLVTVTESAEGEPRIAMLDPIRMFARDQLAATGELRSAQERHARFYLEVARAQMPRFDSNQHLAARQRMEVEQDNMREALAWMLDADRRSAHREQISLALGLCVALEPFWRATSSYREGVRWLEAAVEQGHGDDQLGLARCLAMLAEFLVRLGEHERARSRATASVDIWRRLGDQGTGLALALRTLANSLEHANKPEAARPAYEEALRVARASADPVLLHRILGYVAAFEALEHDEARSLELDSEALAIARDVGDVGAELAYRNNIACTLRILGRVDEADVQMRHLIPQALTMSEPVELAYFAEDYAAISAELGRHEPAVRLLGAAEALRVDLGTPRPHWQDAEIAASIKRSRAALSPAEWERAYRRGYETAIDVALAEAADLFAAGVSR